MHSQVSTVTGSAGSQAGWHKPQREGGDREAVGPGCIRVREEACDPEFAASLLSYKASDSLINGGEKNQDASHEKYVSFYFPPPFTEPEGLFTD